MSVALCMIVKPDDEEAKLLERCLKSAAPHVDGIFTTITGQNAACEAVAESFGASVTRFAWTKDFAAARAFSFGVVPPEFDYVLWLDCDDVLVGGQNVRNVAERMSQQDVRGCVAWYLYAFDEDGNCITRHKKMRMVRNDGSYRWNTDMGELHEDLQQTHTVKVAELNQSEQDHYFEVHHLSNDKRLHENGKRNYDIAKEQVKKHPNDPRATYNLANSCIGVGDLKGALKSFEKFIRTSGSDEERYLALHQMGRLHTDLKDFKKGMACFYEAMLLRPWYPDAYIGMGASFYKQEKWAHAREFLIQGLSKPVPEDIIVYNPRDYDQNPLILLANCYFNMGKPKECRRVLQNVVAQFPAHEASRKMLEAVESICEDADKVESLLAEAQTLTKAELAIRLDSIPENMQMHPDVCTLRNEHFKRETTTGKQIDIYCGFTEEPWGPDSVNKGIGGSEEAVINLAERWSAAGYDVTVYNNVLPGSDETIVNYLPYWMFNPKDKFDTLILWRSPLLADRKLDAKQVLVDLHDVVPQEEFTPARLANVTKLMVKSRYHRSLYPDIPDEKFIIIPNGIDLSHFAGSEERVPHSLIYTSSPDRGLEHLLDAWPEIRSQVPDATLQVFYGWGVFDSVWKTDARMMQWKKDMIDKMNQPGIRLRGRVGHKEIAREMMKSEVFAYPCHFEEISCISYMKAVAAGCKIATTDYAALEAYEDSGPAHKGEWDLYTKQLVNTLLGQNTASESPSKWNWNNVSSIWLSHIDPHDEV